MRFASTLSEFHTSKKLQHLIWLTQLKTITTTQGNAGVTQPATQLSAMESTMTANIPSTRASAAAAGLTPMTNAPQSGTVPQVTMLTVLPARNATRSLLIAIMSI